MHERVCSQESASAESTSSSLSYLSVAGTPSPERPGNWTPRRRHAPPPVLPAHRRAKSYADLLPFEISQLASVLCHGPPANAPRDGAVWTTYVTATNERMALLGPKLRAQSALPSFLPWSAKHGLCSLHRRLNGGLLEDIFAALRFEVEVRKAEVWDPVARAGGLSGPQTEMLDLMDKLQGLWLTPAEFAAKFDRLPSAKFGHQADGCVGCILARMGGSVETAMALGGLLLGSMRHSNMLSTRVCWCREWIRYTVEGDVDAVDAALAEMEVIGTHFRNARKYVRERERATREHQSKKFDLAGGFNTQQTNSDDTNIRQRAVTTGHQLSTKSSRAFDNNHKQWERNDPDNDHGRQRAVTTGQQYAPQHFPAEHFPSQQTPSQFSYQQAATERYLPEQLSPEPTLTQQPFVKQRSQAHVSHEQEELSQAYFSLSPSPTLSPPPLFSPRSRASQRQLQQQPDREARNTRLTSSTADSAKSQPQYHLPQTAASSLATAENGMVRTPSPTRNPHSSVYSQFSTNPFLDQNDDEDIPPMPPLRHLPPDLPFRLFDWRRVDASSGQVSPASPQKHAVQIQPGVALSPEREVALDVRKSGSPPKMSKLASDKGVGALWRRRAEKNEGGPVGGRWFRGSLSCQSGAET